MAQISLRIEDDVKKMADEKMFCFRKSYINGCKSRIRPIVGRI